MSIANVTFPRFACLNPIYTIARRRAVLGSRTTASPLERQQSSCWEPPLVSATAGQLIFFVIHPLRAASVPLPALLLQ